jgi:NAD(P)-dependent dehydrogenase (short-subunit alcohol dehydrogenase family)
MTNGTGLRSYAGAVAVVTGAASGLGRALAEELAARRAEVVVADRQEDLAHYVADEINAAGGRATATGLDVRDHEQVRSLIEESYQRTGRLDYVFNNAGVAVGGFTHRMSIADWNGMIDVNLKGVVHGLHAAYPIMLRQGFGHIVNTGSITGLTLGPPGYGATKAAIVSASLALRVEAEAHGVRVSVICPGAVKSPMIEDGGRFGKNYDVPKELLEEYFKKFRPVCPVKLARRALDAVAKNEAIIIEPPFFRIFWWLYRLAPDLTFFVGKKRFAEVEGQLAARGIRPFDPQVIAGGDPEPEANRAAAVVAVEPSDGSAEPRAADLQPV